jgi:hypothetical protein
MDLVQGQASVLLEDLDYYELDKVNEIINGALANKVIQSVDIEWNWYQMMDDNFELEEQLHFAPLGIVLGFEDDKSLQLAAIQFGLDDKSIANLSYLPEGDLLVSLNNTFDIHLNDDEA